MKREKVGLYRGRPEDSDPTDLEYQAAEYDRTRVEARKLQPPNPNRDGDRDDAPEFFQWM